MPSHYFLTGDPIQTAVRSLYDSPRSSRGSSFEPTGSALDDLFLESVETTEKSSQEEFSPRELNTVKTNLMADEGSRNYVYKDTKGYWTTGIGHLIGDGSTAALDASEFKDIERQVNGVVTKNKGNYLEGDKIESIFNEEFKKHIASARTTPGWDKADSLQREALVNLDFNMGKWWAKKNKKGGWEWPKARAALQIGDFDEVAKQLENTEYSRTVKTRADRVIKKMRGVEKRIVGITDNGKYYLTNYGDGSIPIKDAPKSLVKEFNEGL